MLNIAVTGKAGQVARALQEIAPAHGIGLTLVSRPEVDLADARAVAAAVAGLNADVLVNAAAYTAVDQAEVDAAAAFAVNAAGAAHVAAACARRGMPVIHLSTDYVFDGTKTGPYLEADPPSALGVYGRSKWQGEQEVARACADHIILRTAWVHSPFGRNFVSTLLRLASERDVIAVVDDQHGNPTNALHLAGAIASIAKRIATDRARIPWGTYHCVNDGEASWHDVAVAMFARSRELGGPHARLRAIPSSAYATRARRPANSRLATGKLAGVFDIRLPDWREGVRLTVSRLLAGSERGDSMCG